MHTLSLTLTPVPEPHTINSECEVVSTLSLGPAQQEVYMERGPRLEGGGMAVPCGD